MKKLITLIIICLYLNLEGQSFKSGTNYINDTNQVFPSFIVYPNPTNDIFYLTTNTKTLSVSLLNNKMEVIQTNINPNIETRFNLDRRAKGIYLLIIEMNNKTISKKVVKQK
jgi:hypothetical protein